MTIDGIPEISRRPWWIGACALFIVIGLVAWVRCLAGPDAVRAWRALLIAFIYFTPVTGGLVVWSAIVQLSRGRWAGQLERVNWSGMSFALPSIVALAALWIGAKSWAPIAKTPAPQGAWLDPTFVFARDLAALAVFWVLAWFYVRARRQDRGLFVNVLGNPGATASESAQKQCPPIGMRIPAQVERDSNETGGHCFSQGVEAVAPGRGKTLGGFLIVTYCLVFSLIAFDLVMALDPYWYSTLFGGSFFITGLYVAVTAWTLLSMGQPGGTTDRLHDMGKLIVTFSILSTYLMFAQLLLIWYENIPQETRFLVPRMNYTPWVYVSASLGLALLGPLVLLLTIRSKRTRWFLAAVAIMILAIMWVERWWLVAPTFSLYDKDMPLSSLPMGLAEVSISAAMLGAAGLGIALSLRRMPAETVAEMEPLNNWATEAEVAERKDRTMIPLRALCVWALAQGRVPCPDGSAAGHVPATAPRPNMPCPKAVKAWHPAEFQTDDP